MEDQRKNDQKIMEQVQKLEITMSTIQNDLKYIRDNQTKNEVQHSQILEKIDGFIESSENRFADKKDHKDSMAKMEEIVVGLEHKFAPRVAWTIMVWVARILGTAALVGLSTLIYRVVILLEQ